VILVGSVNPSVACGLASVVSGTQCGARLTASYVIVTCVAVWQSGLPSAIGCDESGFELVEVEIVHFHASLSRRRVAISIVVAMSTFGLPMVRMYSAWRAMAEVRIDWIMAAFPFVADRGTIGLFEQISKRFFRAKFGNENNG
jgi:hypothetical protein